MGARKEWSLWLESSMTTGERSSKRRARVTDAVSACEQSADAHFDGALPEVSPVFHPRRFSCN
jgi:hypothetical protein